MRLLQKGIAKGDGPLPAGGILFFPPEAPFSKSPKIAQR